MLTQDQVNAYHQDGYIIIKSFLDVEEKPIIPAIPHSKRY